MSRHCHANNSTGTEAGSIGTCHSRWMLKQSHQHHFCKQLLFPATCATKTLVQSGCCCWC
jgi:hypothetical protein